MPEQAPFTESTKQLHSYEAIRSHDHKLGENPGALMSQALDCVRTETGLEIHATMNNNGILLLGHPTKADFAARRIVTSHAMMPDDLVRAIGISKHIQRVTLDHRPYGEGSARTMLDAITIGILAKKLLNIGKEVSVNSTNASFLDEIANYLDSNKNVEPSVTFQQQVEVPVWKGLLPGVAMRALEKTGQNGGISEHAGQVRIGDGFPVTKVDIAEVTDFVAGNGFKDGIPRTLHATAAPTVGRAGEPFKLGEIIESRQLKNIAEVAKLTNGAISGVTRFARG